MFDRLVDLFLQFADLFRFFSIVREGTRTVIYTLGRPTRTLGPRDGLFRTGFHFKVPFNIEMDDSTSVREDIYTMAEQTLSTRDGKDVYVGGAFRFLILPDKVELWQTTLGDEQGAVPAIFRASIAETIVRRPLEDLLDPEELKGLRQEILERSRKELNRYGYKVHDFWWVGRIAVKRTYRLITGE